MGNISRGEGGLGPSTESRRYGGESRLEGGWLPNALWGLQPEGWGGGRGSEDVALKAGRGQFQAEAESRGRGGSAVGAVGRRPSRQTKAG